MAGFDGERLLPTRSASARRRSRSGTARGRRAQPPFARYVFLLNAVEDGHGGLEHRASTALIAAAARPAAAPHGRAERRLRRPARADQPRVLPRLERQAPEAARVRALDYTRENYTALLWFFEGFTSYYDDLLLLRAGLIDAARYLRCSARPINAVLATPGRQVQSVAQASFDAWVKYYRSDENTPNATVSYYAKGALVALALDLSLREAGSSLDEVMRALWQPAGGGPISEADIAAGRRSRRRPRAGARSAAWVHGTGELPLPPLLRGGGGRGAAARPRRWRPALGLRLSEGPLTGVQVKPVLRGSAAEARRASRGRRAAGRRRLAPAPPRRRAAVAERGRPFELLVVRDQRVLR